MYKDSVYTSMQYKIIQLKKWCKIFTVTLSDTNLIVELSCCVTQLPKHYDGVIRHIRLA